MKAFVTGRQTGKTTHSIKWVSDGTPVPGYPGWSRVLVVGSRSEFERLRKMLWGKLDDLDHRVYFHADWRQAGHVTPDTEVLIDNVEWLFPRMPGHLVAITMTGELWEP